MVGADRAPRRDRERPRRAPQARSARPGRRPQDAGVTSMNLHSPKNPRVLLGIAFVLAILAVALWPRSTAVEMAPVERGPLRVTIDEEGETRVRDRFVVTAPVAGRVQRVELEPGDPVKA